MAKRISKDLEEKICQLYVDGLSQYDIVNIVGKSYSTVNRTIRRNSIKQRETKFTHRISDEQSREMIKLYLSGISTTDIAKKYAIRPGSVILHLKKNGIERRDRNDYPQAGGRKQFKFNFFEKESYNSAYIAGFIYGDGTLVTNNASEVNNVAITIHEKDRDILEFIAKEINMQSNSVIKKRGRGIIKLSFAHPRLKEDLHKYGIVHRKTYDFSEPYFDRAFFGDFLRGLIDADGHISIRFPKNHILHSKTGKWPIISICSSKEMAKWLQNELQEYGISSKLELYSNKCWGKVLIRSLEGIYKTVRLCNPHNNFCMSRKWDDAIDFCKRYESASSVWPKKIVYYKDGSAKYHFDSYKEGEVHNMCSSRLASAASRGGITYGMKVKVFSYLPSTKTVESI